MSESLGVRLRTLRKQRKLTQVDVAAAIGTSRVHVTKIERDNHRPGREVLMALASFYNVSLDWLASGQGSERASAKAENEQEALLLYAFRAMPENEAKPLLEMMLNRVRPPQN